MFRSPRPDFIETARWRRGKRRAEPHCSGLQDRTSLRHERQCATAGEIVDCSALHDRTSLRRLDFGQDVPARTILFRSPRPDFIETAPSSRPRSTSHGSLFRSPRPDFIETARLGPLRSIATYLFRSLGPDSFATRPAPSGSESGTLMPRFSAWCMYCGWVARAARW